jgi:hypothetical protein
MKKKWNIIGNDKGKKVYTISQSQFIINLYIINNY